MLKPVYIVEVPKFGPAPDFVPSVLKVSFYPLLLEHARSVAMPDNPEERTAENAHASLLNQFLLSAQRGDPRVTLEDIKAVVDLENQLKISQAISGRAASFVSAEDASGPTSPQNGGTSTGALQPPPAGAST